MTEVLLFPQPPDSPVVLPIKATRLALRLLVGGPLKEMALDWQDALMFCDEEGERRGRLYNERANAILALFSPEVAAGHRVFGPAVITGPPDANGLYASTSYVFIALA